MESIEKRDWNTINEYVRLSLIVLVSCVNCCVRVDRGVSEGDSVITLSCPS